MTVQELSYRYIANFILIIVKASRMRSTLKLNFLMEDARFNASIV
jgi:hypothetical protein